MPNGSCLPRQSNLNAGSLCYYLGLITPNDKCCFTEVDGERHRWRAGEGATFDKTYLRYAQNQIGQKSVDFALWHRAAIVLWLGTGGVSPGQQHHRTEKRGHRIVYVDKLFKSILPARFMMAQKAYSLEGTEPHPLGFK